MQYNILSFKEREKVVNSWLNYRLDNLLPLLMKRNNIDCWVVINREHNEDPVFKNLTPFAMFSARRLTILVFKLVDNKVRRIALTHPIPDLYPLYEFGWSNHDSDQFTCLDKLLTQLNPLNIAIDISSISEYSDGLSYSLAAQLKNKLSNTNRSKIISAQNLVIDYLSSRTKQELIAYQSIAKIAQNIIKEAFSNNFINPGITTNDDVRYFMMQKTIDLGLMPWFDYETSIIRNGKQLEGENIIEPGDLLHCDMGFKYLSLCTDFQENAYVLKPYEQQAPKDLRDGLKIVNHFQDIVLSTFKENKTGNEILKESLDLAKESGIIATLYSHPIGFDGHAAGPTIGLWDHQEGVKGTGDFKVYNNTAYSLELNCQIKLASGEEFKLGAETDFVFIENKTYFLGKRQEEYHLV